MTTLLCPLDCLPSQHAQPIRKERRCITRWRCPGYSAYLPTVCIDQAVRTAARLTSDNSGRLNRISQIGRADSGSTIVLGSTLNTHPKSIVSGCNWWISAPISQSKGLFSRWSGGALIPNNATPAEAHHCHSPLATVRAIQNRRGNTGITGKGAMLR